MLQPFLDPAVIDSSIVAISGGPAHIPSHIGVESKSKEGGIAALEPGNALSKLLDLAMANAAKELTPDLERGSPETKDSPRSDFLSYIPDKKPASAHVYSIEQLLALRRTPEVASFDLSRLPEPSFWGSSKPPPKLSKNLNKERRENGGSRKNRHNNAKSNNSNPIMWERRPAGFLKSSEIDNMSQEKILQLLGETGDEGIPEWDSQDVTQDLSMDMGLTVEDFERWKQHMRKEERRKHGDDDDDIEDHDDDDVPRPNEVDSFFSFVRPQELSSPAARTADTKSSRFLSFFNEEKKPSTSSEHSRFFGLETPKRQVAPRSQPPQNQPLQSQPLHSQEHRSQSQQQSQRQNQMQQNHVPNVQQSQVSQARGQSQMQNIIQSLVGQSQIGQNHNQIPQGMPSQMMPPMMQGGMRPGPPGLGMSNDSFFMSLMSKREVPKDDTPSPQQAAKSQSPAQSRHDAKYPSMPGFYPYGPPPGIFQGNMPPGMHPGLRQPSQGQPQPGQGQPRNGSSGQGQPEQSQSSQGQQGQLNQGQMNTQSIQKGQSMGQYPPPGFYMYPPGMGNMGPPPGMPPQGVPPPGLPPHLRPPLNK